MAKYRHTITGGERDSSSKLGFPWELVEGSKSSEDSKSGKAAKGPRAKAVEKGEAQAEEPEEET